MASLQVADPGWLVAALTELVATAPCGADGHAIAAEATRRALETASGFLPFTANGVSAEHVSIVVNWITYGLRAWSRVVSRCAEAPRNDSQDSHSDTDGNPTDRVRMLSELAVWLCAPWDSPYVFPLYRALAPIIGDASITVGRRLQIASQTLGWRRNVSRVFVQLGTDPIVQLARAVIDAPDALAVTQRDVDVAVGLLVDFYGCTFLGHISPDDALRDLPSLARLAASARTADPAVAVSMICQQVPDRRSVALTARCLLRAVRNEDAKRDVRVASASALARMLKWRSTEFADVAAAAIDAFVEGIAPRVDALRSVASRHGLWQARSDLLFADSLARVVESATRNPASAVVVVDRINKHAASPSWRVRAAMVLGLDKGEFALQSSCCKDALVRASTDAHPLVRFCAVSAMARAEGPLFDSCAPALVDALNQELDHRGPAVVTAATVNALWCVCGALRNIAASHSAAEASPSLLTAQDPPGPINVSGLPRLALAVLRHLRTSRCPTVTAAAATACTWFGNINDASPDLIADIIGQLAEFATGALGLGSGDDGTLLDEEPCWLAGIVCRAGPHRSTTQALVNIASDGYVEGFSVAPVRSITGELPTDIAALRLELQSAAGAQSASNIATDVVRTALDLAAYAAPDGIDAAGADRLSLAFRAVVLRHGGDADRSLRCSLYGAIAAFLELQSTEHLRRHFAAYLKLALQGIEFAMTLFASSSDGSVKPEDEAFWVLQSALDAVSLLLAFAWDVCPGDAGAFVGDVAAVLRNADIVRAHVSDESDADVFGNVACRVLELIPVCGVTPDAGCVLAASVVRHTLASAVRSPWKPAPWAASLLGSVPRAALRLQSFVAEAGGDDALDRLLLIAQIHLAQAFQLCDESASAVYRETEAMDALDARVSEHEPDIHEAATFLFYVLRHADDPAVRETAFAGLVEPAPMPAAHSEHTWLHRLYIAGSLWRCISSPRHNAWEHAHRAPTLVRITNSLCSFACPVVFHLPTRDVTSPDLGSRFRFIAHAATHLDTLAVVAVTEHADEVAAAASELQLSPGLGAALKFIGSMSQLRAAERDDAGFRWDWLGAALRLVGVALERPRYSQALLDSCTATFRLPARDAARKCLELVAGCLALVPGDDARYFCDVVCGVVDTAEAMDYASCAFLAASGPPALARLFTACQAWRQREAAAAPLPPDGMAESPASRTEAGQPPPAKAARAETQQTPVD